MKLLKTTLKESINSIIHTRDKAEGRLTQVLYDQNNDPQYAVIATNHFAGNELRYFAIPALKSFLNITKNGNITFKVSQNDLAFARRIKFEECPTIEKRDFIPSIYEANAIYEVYGDGISAS